jgi:hypothetical protein
MILKYFNKVIVRLGSLDCACKWGMKQVALLELNNSNADKDSGILSHLLRALL